MLKIFSQLNIDPSKSISNFKLLKNKQITQLICFLSTPMHNADGNQTCN